MRERINALRIRLEALGNRVLGEVQLLKDMFRDPGMLFSMGEDILLYVLYAAEGLWICCGAAWYFGLLEMGEEEEALRRVITWVYLVAILFCQHGMMIVL